ncbi:MAG: hypothetical protein HN356_01525 [Calditrichaeota bacterium]|jgi:hypothetical protein|nr:hypothetical protein [Calditrichota bacterium]MBT7618479.1 hypothetical protein [Calditrichota bacterium]MBT7788168.1 hypothetical protein [Calditrichota bacterium]
MPRKKENTKMRVSTVIRQMKISRNLAAAVRVKHNLKSTDRIEPDKFRELVEAWRKQPAGVN